MTHNCIAISKKNLIKGTKIDNQSFMKNLPALLFLCVLILTSCKTDTKTSIEESKQFDYRAYLLKDQNAPTIKVTSNFEVNQILKSVHSIFVDSLPVSNFNSQYYDIVIASESWDHTLSRRTPLAHGFINTELIITDSLIFFNYKTLKLDQLEAESYDWFIENIEDKRNFYIQILIDVKTNDSDIYRALKILSNGYIKSMERLAQEFFGKPLNQLIVEELEYLKDKRQFTLKFVKLG